MVRGNERHRKLYSLEKTHIQAFFYTKYCVSLYRALYVQFSLYTSHNVLFRLFYIHVPVTLHGFSTFWKLFYFFLLFYIFFNALPHLLLRFSQDKRFSPNGRSGSAQSLCWCHNVTAVHHHFDLVHVKTPTYLGGFLQFYSELSIFQMLSKCSSNNLQIENISGVSWLAIVVSQDSRTLRTQNLTYFPILSCSKQREQFVHSNACNPVQFAWSELLLTVLDSLKCFQSVRLDFGGTVCPRDSWNLSHNRKY